MPRSERLTERSVQYGNRIVRTPSVIDISGQADGPERQSDVE